MRELVFILLLVGSAPSVAPTSSGPLTPTNALPRAGIANGNPCLHAGFGATLEQAGEGEEIMEALKQCASVILTDDSEQILFVYQERQRYGFPGGVVDLGETPPQAAVREAKEEVNVEVSLEYLVGTYLLRGGGLPDIFASVYKGRILSGEPKTDGHEILRVDWLEPHTPPIPLLPDAAAALPDFLAGKKGVVKDFWRTETLPFAEGES